MFNDEDLNDKMKITGILMLIFIVLNICIIGVKEIRFQLKPDEEKEQILSEQKKEEEAIAKQQQQVLNELDALEKKYAIEFDTHGAFNIDYGPYLYSGSLNEKIWVKCENIELCTKDMIFDVLEAYKQIDEDYTYGELKELNFKTPYSDKNIPESGIWSEGSYSTSDMKYKNNKNFDICKNKEDGYILDAEMGSSYEYDGYYLDVCNGPFVTNIQTSEKVYSEYVSGSIEKTKIVNI